MMNIQLVQGEFILHQGGASHRKGFEFVGGHLWLTNMRLFFKSHSINFQVHETSISLTDIYSVERHNVIPTWMTVVLKNGQRELFVVFSRDGWVRLIQEKIYQAQPQSLIPVQPNFSPLNGNIPVTPYQYPEFSGSAATHPPTPLQYIQPPKDRTIALMLQILPSLIGVFGIGWLYSGNTPLGLLWLIGGFIWGLISIVVLSISGGIALICFIPVDIVLIVIAAVTLNKFVSQHPETFG